MQSFLLGNYFTFKEDQSTLSFSCFQALMFQGISNQCYPHYFVISRKFQLFPYLVQKVEITLTNIFNERDVTYFE